MKLLENWALAVLVCLSSNAWAAENREFPIFSGTDGGQSITTIGEQDKKLAEVLSGIAKKAGVKGDLHPLPILRLEPFEQEWRGKTAGMYWGNPAYASLIMEKAEDFAAIVGRKQAIRPTTVVRADSPYKTIDDLKGEFIGLNPEAMVSWAAISGLKSYGLKWWEIRSTMSQKDSLEILAAKGCIDSKKRDKNRSEKVEQIWSIDCPKEGEWYYTTNLGSAKKVKAIVMRGEVAIRANKLAEEFGKPAPFRIIESASMPTLPGFALMIHRDFFPARSALADFLIKLNPGSNCKVGSPKSTDEEILEALNTACAKLIAFESEVEAAFFKAAKEMRSTILPAAREGRRIAAKNRLENP